MTKHIRIEPDLSTKNRMFVFRGNIAILLPRNSRLICVAAMSQEIEIGPLYPIHIYITEGIVGSGLVDLCKFMRICEFLHMNFAPCSLGHAAQLPKPIFILHSTRTLC